MSDLRRAHSRAGTMLAVPSGRCVMRGFVLSCVSLSFDQFNVHINSDLRLEVIISKSCNRPLGQKIGDSHYGDHPSH